jgi:ABC-type transport system substrate-binding protein
MVDMDWQSLVARRAKKVPVSEGGWNAFMTAWGATDVLNPVSTVFLAPNCDAAAPGWPCDPEMEKLRDQFAHESDLGRQKALAEQVQLRAIPRSRPIPTSWLCRRLRSCPSTTAQSSRCSAMTARRRLRRCSSDAISATASR